jgi:creatinine amidohydrolase/Fe(II)-dependent formamide hydrolase-like protein
MRSILLGTIAALGAWLAAIPDPVNPDPDSPRPIQAVDSVFIERLTWMEVRDAIRAGKKTVLVPTGGVEQNGPYLATGKHNFILQVVAERIARKLEDCLVAPIVPFVPEGDIDPPSLHMKYPGTLSVTESTYRALLTDLCESLRVNGFERIVLIGDSGGNQDGMKEVAARLNERWARKTVRAYYIPEFYDYSGVAAWLEKQGVQQTPQGLHDDFGTTIQMMVADPTTVRMKERQAAGLFSINGVELAPAEKSIALGKRLIEFRAETTIKAIRAAFAQ